jgi:hypothetical protein
MRVQDALRAPGADPLEEGRRVHQVGEEQRDRGRGHRLRSYYLRWSPGKRCILSGLTPPAALTGDTDAEL